MEEPAYTVAIDGEGVAIRKTVSKETLRKVMNIVLLEEAKENALRASLSEPTA